MKKAWATAHPTDTEPLVASSIDDDAVVLWLNYRTPEAEAFAFGASHVLPHGDQEALGRPDSPSFVPDV